MWHVSFATDPFSFVLEQTLWSRMLVRGDCLVNILISASKKADFTLLCHLPYYFHYSLSG